MWKLLHYWVMKEVLLFCHWNNRNCCVCIEILMFLFEYYLRICSYTYLTLVACLVWTPSCYISKILSKAGYYYYHQRCSCSLWNQSCDCLNINDSATFQHEKIQAYQFSPQCLSAGKLCHLVAFKYYNIKIQKNKTSLRR